MHPMLASAGPLPEGPDWVYEISWRGPRVVVDISTERVIAWADGRVVTARYPELVAMAAGIDDALLDGYLIDVAGAPANFVVVDLFRLYGVDLLARPLRERRRSLDRLAQRHGRLTLSPVFDDAPATRTAAERHGLPGVVAKRLNSIYTPALSSRDWVEDRLEPAINEDTAIAEGAITEGGSDG